MKVPDLLAVLVLIAPGFAVQWLLDSWHPQKEISEPSRVYRSLVLTALLYVLVIPALEHIPGLREAIGLKVPVTTQYLEAHAFETRVLLSLTVSTLILAGAISFCMRQNLFYRVSRRLGLTARANPHSVFRGTVGDPSTAGYITKMGKDGREYSGELECSPSDPDDNWVYLRNVWIRQPNAHSFDPQPEEVRLLINIRDGECLLHQVTDAQKSNNELVNQLRRVVRKRA